MLVLNSEQMHKADEMASEQYGILGVVLMENAARSLYDYIKKLRLKSIVIVCGSGNNGGDGFALARLLMVDGIKVQVFCFSQLEKVKGDAKINLSILKQMDIPIEDSVDKLNVALEQCEAVVDAMFGTGFKGEIKGHYKEAVCLINKCNRIVISVDIPSGICCDDGESNGVYVHANYTITFCCIKPAHVLGSGRKASGRLVVCNIGMPRECILNQGSYIETNLGDYPLCLLKNRRMDTNKGDYGRVYIWAGSYEMSGAAILCTKAALRTGSGLVTAVIPDSIIERVSSGVPEAIYITTSENWKYTDSENEGLKKMLNSADAIAIGPGLGKGPEALSALTMLLRRYAGYMVIDADGINLLAENKELMSLLSPNVILTPHPGEMSRLTGFSTQYINKNRLSVAFNFARENHCVILLKGSSTVISDGKSIYINTSGNPGMATAGSGDVLTGMVASLLGQGYNPWEASIIGCCLHGNAGDEALTQHGYGLIASDIIDNIAVKKDVIYSYHGE